VRGSLLTSDCQGERERKYEEWGTNANWKKTSRGRGGTDFPTTSKGGRHGRGKKEEGEVKGKTRKPSLLHTQ